MLHRGVKHVDILPYCEIHTSYIYILTLREKMAQAYDFALDKIGMEIMSYQVHRSDVCICTCVYEVNYCRLTAVLSSPRFGWIT